MKVRDKLVITLGLTMLATLIGIYNISSKGIISGFISLENQEAEEDVIRVGKAFTGMIDGLHEASVDWANWDDTYSFISTLDQTYVKSNLADGSMSDMRLDFVAYFDTTNKPLFSKHLPSSQLQTKLTTDSFSQVLQSVGPTGGNGVFLRGDDPISYSIRPILRSDKSGPSRGWLLFARFLDESTQAELSKVTSHAVELTPITKIDKSSALAKLTGAGTKIVPISDEVIAGYAVISDNAGNPQIMLKAMLPRTVSLAGRSVALSLLSQIIFITLGVTVLTIFFLEKFALSRLARLTKQVQRIQDSSGEGKITVSGRDEFTFLASAINEMLLKIDEGKQQLVRHNEDLELVVHERTEEIKHQAFHDKLTNLPNRALFMDRLEFAQKKAARSHEGVAVFFIDLDNFKLVNDSLGHDAGDQLLLAVADRFANAVRPGDTVARLGGDEFTVLLEGLHSDSDAIIVAERVMTSLRKPIQINGQEAFACLSLGLAYCNDHNVPATTILKQADTAMYRAKANGKSTYMVYDATMEDYAAERLEMETALRKAIDNKELCVHYQPLVALSDTHLIGAEALARWNSPKFGFVSPGRFIPIAEDTGLIIPIGYWVLEQACVQAKQWIDANNLTEFVMSVNLSGKQLQRDDVVSRISEILEKTGLPPASLKLEITESVLMSDRESVALKLRQLKDLGVLLALDDFGTGYSSLATLRAFPIDTLKIDRSFISRLGEEEGAQAIVEAILALARTMGLDVTGEGVETAFQQGVISKLGCTTGQGYLFSKPLTSTDFDTFLAGFEQHLSDAA